MRNYLGLAFIVVLAAAAGCGEKSPYEMGQISGKVTYKGAGVAGATVVFHPAQGKLGIATTDAEGNYSLECNTGAAKITVDKSTSAGGSQVSAGEGQVAATGDMEKMQERMRAGGEDPNAMIEAAEAPKSELPAQYSKVDTTPESITIVAGENKKDLELVD